MTLKSVNHNNVSCASLNQRIQVRSGISFRKALAIDITFLARSGGHIEKIQGENKEQYDCKFSTWSLSEAG